MTVTEVYHGVNISFIKIKSITNIYLSVTTVYQIVIEL